MNERQRYTAIDTRRVTLDMLGLLGRAIVIGVAVSATAALVIVGVVAAAA